MIAYRKFVGTAGLTTIDLNGLQELSVPASSRSPVKRIAGIPARVFIRLALKISSIFAPSSIETSKSRRSYSGSFMEKASAGVMELTFIPNEESILSVDRDPLHSLQT